MDASLVELGDHLLQFFLCSPEIGPIVAPQNLRLSSSTDEPAQRTKKRISIQTMGDLDMNGTTHQTRAQTAVAWNSAATLFYL